MFMPVPIWGLMSSALWMPFILRQTAPGDVGHGPVAMYPILWDYSDVYRFMRV